MGRIFVVTILILTYLLAQISDHSIFRLGIWSFSGFAALFPIILAALFWKRSTKFGAVASIVSVGICWTYFFLTLEGQTQTIGNTGLMPVAVLIVVSTIAMISGSLLTRAPSSEHVSRFFAE